MHPTLKTRLDQTKTFVKEHKTLVACATTAAITSKLSYDIAVKLTTKKFYSDDGDLYKTMMILAATWDFMERKGLSEQEYIDFIKANK